MMYNDQKINAVEKHINNFKRIYTSEFKLLIKYILFTQYLLGDTSILKVGYGINIDAKNLREDYGLVVRCFVDLVYIGDYVVGERGLKKISAASVGIVYGKSMTCSNWKANRLSFTQQIYAALDAFLPVKILEYCIEKIVSLILICLF